MKFFQDRTEERIEVVRRGMTNPNGPTRAQLQPLIDDAVSNCSGFPFVGTREVQGAISPVHDWIGGVGPAPTIAQIERLIDVARKAVALPPE